MKPHEQVYELARVVTSRLPLSDLEARLALSTLVTRLNHAEEQVAKLVDAQHVVAQLVAACEELMSHRRRWERACEQADAAIALAKGA